MIGLMHTNHAMHTAQIGPREDRLTGIIMTRNTTTRISTRSSAVDTNDGALPPQRHGLYRSCGYSRKPPASLNCARPFKGQVPQLGRATVSPWLRLARQQDDLEHPPAGEAPSSGRAWSHE